MYNSIPTDKYFDSGNLNIHYLEWGNLQNPPMILLHHISSQAHAWDQFAASMSKEYHIVAPDMRGHGNSDWAGEGNYTTEDYASDIEVLVQTLDLNNIIMLGGSTGGRVALVYTAQNPDKVTHLIMEDVGAVRPASISQGFADRIAAGDPEFDTIDEWAKQLSRGNTIASFESFLNNARHCTRLLANARLGLKRDPMIQKDFVPLELWHYVEMITAKFMLLLGANSTIVGDDQQDRFKQIRPDIEIVSIQDAGHIVVQDKPDEFEAAVRQFLFSH